MSPSTTLQPARWESARPSSPSVSSEDASSLPSRMRPSEFRVIKQSSAEKQLLPIPSPPWAKSNKPLPDDVPPPPKSASPSSPGRSWNAHRVGYDSNEGESEIDKDDGGLQSSRYARRPSRFLPRSLSPPAVVRKYSPPPSPSRRYNYKPPPAPMASLSPPSPSKSSSYPFSRAHSYAYPSRQTRPTSPIRHRSYHTLPSHLQPPFVGQKRRFLSEDEYSDSYHDRRMDVDNDSDRKRRESLEREREKASRTLPPLPDRRPGANGHRILSYLGQSPPRPPLGYFSMPPRESHSQTGSLPQSSLSYPRPSHYSQTSKFPSLPPPVGSQPYPHPPPFYRGGPPSGNYPPSNFPPSVPHHQQPYGHPPYPPSSATTSAPYVSQSPYGPPPPPPPPPTHRHYSSAPPPLPPPPPPPPVPPPSQHESSRHRSGLHLSPGPYPSTNTAHGRGPPPPLPQPQQQEPYHHHHHNAPIHHPQQTQPTLYEQAQAARAAASNPSGGSVSGGFTTHPVPFSIGITKGSSAFNLSVNGSGHGSSNGKGNGRGGTVGEYEQHPLRQQTSYLPISAVGGAQFVLKPPRQTKPKNARPKAALLAPAPVQTNPKDVMNRSVGRGGIHKAGAGKENGNVNVNGTPLGCGKTKTSEGEGIVTVRVKQEEEVALVKETGKEATGEDEDGMEGVVPVVDASRVNQDVIILTNGVGNEENSAMDVEPSTTMNAKATVNGAADANASIGAGASTTSILALTSHPPLSSPPHNTPSEPNTSNTFAAPARPSRKIKKYACDICGQIFTRSGDVKRHKDSRHVEGGGGVRCPYCERVLTRQDALQRHWDKYCRKKSKRHVHRHRFYSDGGSGASDDSDSGVVLLDPAPGSGGANGSGGILSRAEKEEDEVALGGASGVDLKSYRVIVTSGRRRMVGANKGKSKARAGGGQGTRCVDVDGDVRMTDDDEDSEVDELESEDQLDGYRYEYDDDSASENERRETRDGLDRGDRDEVDDEVDELDDSGDDEGMEKRGRDDVKSDAEGVSVSDGDEYEYSDDSEDSSEEEENAMDMAGAREGGFGRRRAGFVVEGRSNEAVVFDRSAARQAPLPTIALTPESPPSTTKLAMTSSTNGIATASSSVLNGKTHKPSGSRRRTPASSSSRSAVDGSSSTRTPPPQVVADADTVPRRPPLPMSAFTSTFPAQPNMPRPRGAPGGRTRSSITTAAATAAVVVAPVTASPSRSAKGNGSGNAQSMIALPSPVSGPSNLNAMSHPPRLRSYSRPAHGPARGSSRSRGSSASTRRGPKPRRNDYDAILDPSQTAAQGGQIRMRVLPQATYMPPVQPALAIMHEQPHVAKRKGKRTDGLVPDYGFVPREYVYRERE